jgi:hypothetical protein
MPYGFADCVNFTSGTESELTYWFKNDVIPSDFKDADTKRRKLSFLNLVEVELAHTLAMSTALTVGGLRLALLELRDQGVWEALRQSSTWREREILKVSFWDSETVESQKAQHSSGVAEALADALPFAVVAVSREQAKNTLRPDAARVAAVVFIDLGAIVRKVEGKAGDRL